MLSFELIIISINISLLFFTYFWLYPRVAGEDIQKLSLYDFLTSIVSLIIVASLFFGEGFEFNIIFTTLNWFWFTLVTYLILEVPLALWYFKKNDMWGKM